MPTQESNSVRNGVLGTVIGGIVLAGLAEFWPPFKKLLVWIWDQISRLTTIFTDSYSVPGLAITALVLLGLPTIVRLFLSFRKQNASPYTRYVEDSFYNARWRWGWVAGAVSNLCALCPRCDSELVYDDSSCNSIYSDMKKTDFICEHCGHVAVASIQGGSKSYALSAVEREIRRKVRTNEFPVTQQGS